MKEAQEEPVSSQEGEQLVLKQETDTFMLTPTYEESEHSEPEPNSDQQLSHYSPVAESHEQRGSDHVGPGPSRNEETKRKKRRHNNTSHCDNVDNSPPTKSHCNTHTAAKNNRSSTVMEQFFQAVDEFGVPSRVRCDYGGENKAVCLFMDVF
ncbi:hypothetical protein F2P81_014502 [Scophthalmus maximus]|uniref:Integrase core domain-containing protein n=1 Tax=Scophthalmus maximus TaxID=52904 RepID=A0A6A4SPI9_SCOMX|nr:hypothetical protein F2P81_014502 [Scophthalmus maximus]